MLAWPIAARVQNSGPAPEPSAPTTMQFDDSLTMGMFGDVVSVTTVLDVLGPREEEIDYADARAAKRARHLESGEKQVGVGEVVRFAAVAAAGG